MTVDHLVPLVYSAVNQLIGNWTFPVAFNAAPRAWHNYYSIGQSITPDTSELVIGDVNTTTTTTVSLLQRRISGGTDFSGGDTANTNAHAKGNWR